MEQIVRWKRPAKVGATTPLVVILHGRGGDEDDLFDLAHALPRHAAYVTLRGPIVDAECGYRWYEDRGPGRPIAASLGAAVDRVRGYLDGPDARAYAARTYLLGFSQGMMLAGALLFADPTRYAGAVLLSGALALDGPAPATRDRLAGIPIFTGTGTFDTALPRDLVLATEKYLRERSGAVLTERVYPRDHSIARKEIADIAEWLTERA
jgi:phospholipase/carboxylesterase